MARITVYSGDHSRLIHSLPGETVHMALVRYGIYHHAPCGGQGLCKNCKLTLRGEVMPPQRKEAEFLSDDELLKGIRYACMAVPAGDCQVYLDNTSVSGDEPVSPLEPAFPVDGKEGYACGIDIGTTTLAVYLYASKTGCPVAVVSAQNEQAVFGADVISRIQAVITRQAGPALQASVTRQLGQMLQDACSQAHILPQQISSCTVAANTTMLHFLTGIDPSGIAAAPFTPGSLFGTVYRGEQLGLPLTCEVFLAPCVSAYVGGDITAGMIACDMDRQDQTTLLIDVGTNGEMALSKAGSDTIYCLATAAGPAFEGAHISCGVGGVPGAICRMDEQGFSTVADAPPVGICGSGLLDAVALMLRQGILEDTGYLEEAFSLAPGTSLALTPQDIRELQLAKSAICSGVIRLMELAEVSPEEVDRVLFAGGFGAHINPVSALQIGLIPSSLKGKCVPVGNTAGLGAVMTALSREARGRLEALPDRTEYFELSGDARFNELFMENMMFES